MSFGAAAEFVKGNTYSENTFSDVSESFWYAESVKNVYEFGIMKGVADNMFAPDSKLTVAEGITIAARINEKLTGNEITEKSGEWYQMYVDYAIENEIMADNTFSDFERNIKRHEMASLISAICDGFAEINHVDAVVDINGNAPYAEAVLELYKYGILTGNDAYGNFSPESYLTRAEMAAIAVRVADEDARVSKTFDTLTKRTYGDGYGLIVNYTGTGRTNNGIANGWDYDNRFEMSNTSGWGKKYVADTDDTVFTALIRDFDKESEGTLTLEMMIELWSKDGGLYIAFQNDKEERLLGLTEEDGKWMLFGKETLKTDIAVPTSLKLVSFIVNVDLDNNTMAVSIDNKFVGSVSIPEDAVVERLVLGTNENGSGSVNISHTILMKNYVVFDRFPAVENVVGEVPLNYTVNGDFTVQKMNTGESLDLYSVKGNVKAGENAYAIRSFAPVYGNVDVKTHFLLPEANDGASFSLMAAGSEVLTIYTKDSKFYIGDKKLKKFTKNIWQDLRIEANTEKGEAVIRISSQIIATVPFNASYIDGVKYSFSPDEDAVMWFDDLEIQCLVEHEDYVPKPVVPESDYTIGMYSCYLWRDAYSNEGWDSVSSFPEFEPVLGYYDEGLREAADWEIKQMVEHGIDFVEMCWYAPEENIVNPIKRTKISHAAIHDGFLNAKYSDLMNYCILWETSYKGAKNFEQFKEYIWNYWKDYYFSDERYLVVDNKIVIFTWTGPTAIADVVGGMDKVSEALEWLDADIMDSLGYDGIIWLAANLLTSDATANNIANSGFDGVGGRWIGESSSNASEQIRYFDMNERYADEYKLTYIPCISPGYNDVGRNNTRTGLITEEEHLKVCEYFKNAIDSRNSDDILDNMIIVDSWNEYSEGHTSAPTLSTGYMYLDNIRKVFTNAPEEHSELDVISTDEQRMRITRLYPENHSPIRWFMYEGSDTGVVSTRDPNATNGANAVPVITWDMATEEGLSAWNRGHGLTNYKEGDGVISATSNGDSSIVLENPSLNIDKVEILHIHMKSTINDTAQIYFATSESPVLGDSKKLTFKVRAGEHDYYVDLSNHAEWNGELSSFRVDVLNTVGDFEISLIEFMKSIYDENNPAPQIIINGNPHNMVFIPIKTEDGDYEVAAEATIRGFFSSMRLYHEWDRFTGDGVLTVKTRDKKTYVFTVGSNKVIVDGEEKDLGFTMKLRDGLPVFHIKKFCDLIGYEYSEENSNVYIKAASDKEIALMNMSSGGQWDYTYLTEVGDWKTRQASVSIADGFLNIIPTDTDSSISTTVDWNSDDYTHALIGIKYTDGAENWVTNMFFSTDTQSLSANTMVVQKVDTTGYKKGDIIELKLDMTSNVNWIGTIKSLRFDPHFKLDPVFIKYIKFIKDEENASFANKPKIDTDGTSEAEFPDLPDVQLTLDENDIVHGKYGLLLGEIDFSADGTANYINEKYINAFEVVTFGTRASKYVDGKVANKNKGDTVLDFVPNGTSPSRLNIAYDGGYLQKGKYTITLDVYMPKSNSNASIFRLDTIDMGANQSAYINANKDAWQSMEWSFEVISMNDKQILITDGVNKAAKDLPGLTAVNVWLVKTSASTEEHFYFDNIRCYYDPGTIGTDPDYVAEEERVIVYDDECNIVMDEPDIVDEELGVLLGEVSFDYSYMMASELIKSNSNYIVKASYVNGNYIGGFNTTVFGAQEVAITDTVGTENSDSFVLDITPNGTAAHRVALETKSLALEPGIYTYTVDVFVPKRNADYSTFRLDIVGMGDNFAAKEINGNKDSWYTVKWQFEVKPGENKGEVIVTDLTNEGVMQYDAYTTASMWMVQVSASKKLHCYFDNFRLYYNAAHSN